METAHGIDGKGNDARARASQVMKELLVGHVTAYLQRGSSAMAVYNNNDRPESVASGFEQILRDSPKTVRNNPGFYRYLLEFPNMAPPPTVEDFFYWSKENVRKPVVSLVHVCLARLEDHGQPSYLIGMKHIYDSHYFLAYGEFLSVLPEPGGAKGLYLVRSIRALIDPPRGWLRGFLLGKIKGAMRDQLAKDLLRTRRRLESAPGP